MPARSVCLVTLSLSEAGPGRFGGQVSVIDIYHTIPYHTIPYHVDDGEQVYHPWPHMMGGSSDIIPMPHMSGGSYIIPGRITSSVWAIIMGGRYIIPDQLNELEPELKQARDSHLDLGRAPYDLYGVKYIDLVSLSLKKHEASGSHLGLGRAPYVLYGVKYIDLVPLAPFSVLPGQHGGVRRRARRSAGLCLVCRRRVRSKRGAVITQTALRHFRP